MPSDGYAAVLVEVAVDSLAGARAAAAAGAGRLELCQCLERGGLTPSVGLLEAVRAAVSVPVFAMLRPRAGDFVYDDGELAAMRRDAEVLRAAGADGIVAGALRPDGALDVDCLRALQDAAGGAPLTCHRAFDWCAEPFAALDALAAMGAARVLTSGQASTAPAGRAAIRACAQHAAGRLVVMAGAGVRAANVRELVAATGVREVHLSATTWVDSAMTFRRHGVPMGAPLPADDYRHRATDPAEVAAVVAALAAPRPR